MKRPRQAAAAADPSALPLQLIVRRGAARRFRALKEKAGNLPVTITWDAREGDRRAAATTAAGATPNADRRANDRRQPPPFTWDSADFLVRASSPASPAAPKRQRSTRKSR